MAKWTKERNEELRALYTSKTGPELAEHFGTSVQAVYVQAHKIGLNKPQPNKIELSREREWWLRRNFPHMSNGICALILGISPRSVVRQARRLGLEKTAQFMRECQAHTSKKSPGEPFEKRHISGKRLLLAQPAKRRKISIWETGMEKDRQERCCICGGELRKGGHDPHPVASFGRCCDACNYGVVLPKRIELSKQEDEQRTGKD